LEALAGEDYATTFVPVDNEGVINFDKLKASIKPETILISVMLANNEIGSIQPVAEIGKWLKRINTEREQKGLTRIVLHTDACQAAGSMDINVNNLGVDLMSVNGSKIYGPKQTGFLYVRNGINLKPIIYGGGQEFNLRSGTENVAGVVGLAKALEIADKSKKLGNNEIGKLQKYFISKLLAVPGVSLNGPKADGINRLVNNINVSIKGIEGEALMLYLDSYGISASTGSAFSTSSSEASHVLLAMGKSESEARSSIRFSLGRATTKDDLDYTASLLAKIVQELRKVKSLI
jgi:cysteine desulfurase